MGAKVDRYTDFMSSSRTSADALAETVADRYARVQEVEAVAWAGSRMSHFADERSDIDLYVYCSEMVPLITRSGLVTGAGRAEIGNSFWEPGDEWIDTQTGLGLDVMFRTTPWMEDQLDRVLRRHIASVGYSTCFWYNLRNSRPLFDRAGWLQKMQEKSRQPYPEELQRAIIIKNYPILRSNLSSYTHQLELALQRNDAISVNHRVTALLASYFDLVFAANKQLHPGEKRLVEFAEASCSKLPNSMAEHVQSLLSASASELLNATHVLLDGLDQFLANANLIPLTPTR
jgi:hypothetical protein